MNKEIRRIPLNLDYLSLFKTLKLEQVGEITLSVMGKYANGEKIDIQSEITKAYAMVWCNDVDIAISMKSEKVQKNRANGKLGGEAKARNKREARAQAERQSEDTAPPSDDVPFVEVEEVEKYPFEKFWQLYDMRLNEDDCRKKWYKMRESTKAKVMEHLLKYVASTPNKKYRVAPYKYLSKGYYNNEIIDRTDNNQSASSYGSNNRQRNERTQQQINIERSAQAVARMFSEIRPMQPDGSGN